MSEERLSEEERGELRDAADAYLPRRAWQLLDTLMDEHRTFRLALTASDLDIIDTALGYLRSDVPPWDRSPDFERVELVRAKLAALARLVGTEAP